MYAPFFGLKLDPFSIAPDPRYLFMSERHREALAHLLYGLDGGGGFVLLTGEIGTGKTTVCRGFLEQVPAHCNVAYIFNPKLTALELLRTVCDEFHVPHGARGQQAETVKDCIDPLNAFLLAQHAAGRNNVLIIDEAQNLSAEVLEQLRLLTNLETRERKLLQIILIGQPELRRMLARPELEQLAQRVIARYHLDALSAAETEQYIRHRLAVAGLAGPLPFDAAALARIHQRARGVPRRINLLAGRALLGAYAHGQAVVDKKVVDQAAAEVFEGETAPATAGPSRGALVALGVLGGAAAVGLVALALFAPARAPVPAAASTTATTATTAGAFAASAPAVAASQTTPTPAADARAVFAAAVQPESQGWRTLGTLWGLAMPASNACAAIESLQLQCWRSTSASLALLRQLQRPALLTLHGLQARPAPVLLVGLGTSHALLHTAEGPQAVPLSALAEHWRGEIATIWRVPPGYGGKAGMAALQEWAGARLAELPGASSEAKLPLKTRVAQFQLAQGLAPDGRLGPVTLMQLNRAAGVDEPRLRTDPATP